MSAEESRTKREGLKLAQLASYDDIITDALVDKVYFWTSIRKNRGRYSASRGIKEEDVTDILRDLVVEDKDPIIATERLLEIPGIKKYLQKLSTSEQEHFQRHLRKYVNIYLPDCPFEVSTTNRYEIDRQEAAITARREIRNGELIKYLTGIQAPITKAEETTLDLARLDFSIVMSSRKRTPALFLGPARFANHDCSANARLATTGSNGMSVIAVKDIRLGEEITVTYGENYFGKENCECLCATCENACRNGWSQANGNPGDVPNAHDNGDDGWGPRRSRLVSESARASNSSTPRRPSPKSGTFSEPFRLDMSKKLKTEQTSSPPKSSQLANAGLVVAPPSEQAIMTEFSTARLPSSSSFDSGMPQSLSTLNDASPKSSSTTVTSVDSSKDLVILNPDLNAYSGVQKSIQIPLISVPEITDVAGLENPDTAIETINTALTEGTTGAPFMDVVLREHTEPESASALHSDLNLRGTSATPTSAGSLVAPGEQSDDEEEDSEKNTSEYRKPGDYTLTPLLLSHPFSRWVTCRVCSSNFVQENAYQTREACRRCERHLKLYGYTWPKTEKEGKNDREERIDYRSVIGFVDPTEERIIKKGKSAALKNLLEGKLTVTDSTTSDTGEGFLERPARLRKRIIRPKFDKYAIQDEVPRKKTKKLERTKENLKTGKILSKRHHEASGKPSERLSKRPRISALKTQSGSLRRPTQSTAIKQTGEIITRTGKPRVRAVRSDKGIPRPERRKFNLGQRSLTARTDRSPKKKKRLVALMDGGDDGPNESGINDLKEFSRSKTDVLKSKSKWLGMSTKNSSQKQPGRAPRVKPSWTYVPETEPPPFAAPPSPPPLRARPKAKLQAKKPPAPKKKHSFYYELKVNPAPLAGPPSPPRIGRRSKTSLNEDQNDSGSDESGDEANEAFFPRRSSRASKRKRSEDDGADNSDESLTKEQPRYQASDRLRRFGPKVDVAMDLAPSKRPIEENAQFLDLIIELVKNANMDAEELGNTVNLNAFISKLQMDLANSKEATNPETMNEAMLRDFFETIQGTLTTLQSKNYPQLFYKELFSRLVRSMRSPIQSNDSILASDALKKFQVGIAKIVGKDDPYWKNTMKAIDDMLKRKDDANVNNTPEMTTNVVSATGTFGLILSDDQPRKRRRIIEDISDDDEPSNGYDGSNLPNYQTELPQSNKQDSSGVVGNNSSISRFARTDLRYIMNDADTTSSVTPLNNNNKAKDDDMNRLQIQTNPYNPPVTKRGRGRPRKTTASAQPIMPFALAYPIQLNPYPAMELAPAFQFEERFYNF